MKKKIATVWLGGCSGCHMSLLDIDERILEVAKLADIVKSPIVDFKTAKEIDVVLVEGALSMDEHVEEIHALRKAAKVLIAFGDCAVTGNVTALRNVHPVGEVINRSYREVQSSAGGALPDSPQLGKLLDRVKPLHEEVKVDYTIPGCPPSADLIFYVLNELLNDRKPVIDSEKLKWG